MQGAEDKNTANVPSVTGVSENATMPRGLFAPYEQQSHNIKEMLQNQMTIELHKQLTLLEERAVSCIKSKDQALQEEKRQRRYIQDSLATAIAEIGYWKKLSDKKTMEAKDKALEEEKMKCENLHKRLRNAESEATYWKMKGEVKTVESKDKALEDEKKICENLHTSLRNAEAEGSYWKKLAETRTKTCEELADRLVKSKKREYLCRKEKEKEKYAEEAHSSTGDNEEDKSDPRRGWRKRPRV